MTCRPRRLPPYPAAVFLRGTGGFLIEVMFMGLGAVLRSLRRNGEDWIVDIGEDWMQGRSVFGGMQAAVGVAAMRQCLPAVPPLRTLQTTFIAPVPAGAVRIAARVLRQGKNTVHMEARLLGGEGEREVLCLLVAVFGAARDSLVRRVPERSARALGEALEFRHVPGVTPSFTQHFAVRWLEGSLPYAGQAASTAQLEVGLHDAGPMDEEQVLAIADFPPPLALSAFRTPVPGSSLTWMIEFLGADLSVLQAQGWQLDIEMTAAGQGYTSQSVMLWGPGSVPVALSRQSMVVFG